MPRNLGEVPDVPRESLRLGRGLPWVWVGLPPLSFVAGVTIFVVLNGRTSENRDAVRSAQPVSDPVKSAPQPLSASVTNVTPNPGKIADRPVKVGEIRRFLGSAGEVSAVAFSPDGSRMASGGADRIIRLWDVQSGQELRQFKGHSDSVKGLDFSPDGQSLLSGSQDKTVRLWDVKTGQELNRLEGHTDGVSHVRFSPDGQTAASGSWDHTARLWDLTLGRPLHALKHGDFVVGVAFSPDGRQIATGSWDHLVRLWDVQSGEELERFEGHTDRAGDVAFAPDGLRVLSSSTDQTLRLWNVLTGREVSRCEVGADAGWAVAISPDGRRALSVHDADVILWDLGTSRQIHRFPGHTDQVTDLAFSPDGLSALSTSRDSTIRLWGLPSASAPTPDEPQSIARKPSKPEIKPDSIARANVERAPKPKVDPPSVAIIPSNSWFALRTSAESGSALEGVLRLGAPRVCSKDRSLGTALTWASSPTEAFEQAKAQGKLVMLLHVSGNFEDSGFT